jgi:sugar/nucleoside kinase (ribokinase family)
MSAAFSRLVSVGNAVVDILATVPAVPSPGGDVVATRSGLAAGGSFNVLAAARRLGLASAYGGAHGSGPFGDLVRASLAAEGIDVLLPPVAGEDTGWDVVLTDADGERTFITSVGAEARLPASLIAGIRLDTSDAVHVSGYGLLREPNRSAIRGWLAAAPIQCVVLFDPGPLGHHIDAEVLEAVLRRADWWSGNKAEARAATGAADPGEAARILAARGSGRPGGAVVRVGERGCLLALRGASVLEVPGFDVDVVDTNGAGDAHIGAFLASLATGASPADAARRANAAAALAVSAAGPATAPTAAELDRFLAAHPLN